MKDALKTFASMFAIWSLSLVLCGLLVRISFEIFMLGWNLL